MILFQWREEPAPGSPNWFLLSKQPTHVVRIFFMFSILKLNKYTCAGGQVNTNFL
jgi:hypothetical protein